MGMKWLDIVTGDSVVSVQWLLKDTQLCGCLNITNMSCLTPARHGVSTLLSSLLYKTLKHIIDAKFTPY